VKEGEEHHRKKSEERPTGWAAPPAQLDPAPQAAQLPTVVEQDEELVEVEAYPALQVQANKNKDTTIISVTAQNGGSVQREQGTYKDGQNKDEVNNKARRDSEGKR